MSKTTVNNGPVECMLCGDSHHKISKHLADAHPDYTIDDYKEKFPDAPLASEAFLNAAREAAAKKAKSQTSGKQGMAGAAAVSPINPAQPVSKKAMHELFELPQLPELMLPARGGNPAQPIMVSVPVGLTAEDLECVPEIDEDYVFRVDELKSIMLAIELNKPCLAHGFHGAGKTTIIEQVCARTGRPWVRVQHTDTTEEAHIIGQMVVRNGGTEFEYGPLVQAMLHGWVYVGDEYDFAHPAVIAVYQPVLEGKPLYIKEAPVGKRLIKPHPNFRFFATGNTNGSGDDTGLYSGTKMGNAAAYSRFGVTIQINYPDAKVETAILTNKCGATAEIAEKMVEIATSVRTLYGQGEISIPISPRELIGATQIGYAYGGKFAIGLALAYSNRLDSTQAEAVAKLAQRHFA